jgi:hypothetical protein
MVPTPYKNTHESITFIEIFKYLVTLIHNMKINEELIFETFRQF